MPVYRYKRIFLNAQSLMSQVPGTLSIVGSGPPIFIDIDAPSSSKDDLDAVMASRGWIFAVQDPPSTPTMDARTEPPLLKDLSAGGTFTLTAAEATTRFIILAGTLLGLATVEFPAVAGVDWVVRNNVVLGAFTVTLKVAGSGSAFTIASGTQHVWSNGTDLRKIAPLVP